MQQETGQCQNSSSKDILAVPFNRLGGARSGRGAYALLACVLHELGAVTVVGGGCGHRAAIAIGARAGGSCA